MELGIICNVVLLKCSCARLFPYTKIYTIVHRHRKVAGAVSGQLWPRASCLSTDAVTKWAYDVGQRKWSESDPKSCAHLLVSVSATGTVSRVAAAEFS